MYCFVLEKAVCILWKKCQKSKLICIFGTAPLWIQLFLALNAKMLKFGILTKALAAFGYLSLPSRKWKLRQADFESPPYDVIRSKGNLPFLCFARPENLKIRTRFWVFPQEISWLANEWSMAVDKYLDVQMNTKVFKPLKNQWVNFWCVA